MNTQQKQPSHQKTTDNPEVNPDSALLSALSLVVRANVEYAKGVTELISSDLEKDDKLSEIDSNVNQLLAKTDRLIASQEQLLKAIQEHNKEDHQYIDKKFEPLYKGAGLKLDGSEHAPADKWVVAFQRAASSKILTLLAGALLTWLAKVLLSGFFK